MDPGGNQRVGNLLTSEAMLVSIYLHQKEVCTANRCTIGGDQVVHSILKAGLEELVLPRSFV